MKYILSLVLFLCIYGCSFPKDPQNSYIKAQDSFLQIGYTLNPPFTQYINGKPDGIEIDILREFAKSKNLKIKFQKGSESELIDKLKNYDLHIVAGGFDKKTIWKRDAGTSIPYDKEHLFLIPKGENRLLRELETYI